MNLRPVLATATVAAARRAPAHRSDTARGAAGELSDPRSETTLRAADSAGSAARVPGGPSTGGAAGVRAPATARRA